MANTNSLYKSTRWSNPTHSTKPTPGHLTQPFHHLTTVEHVRSVGCNWSFYPGAYPPLAPDLANSLSAIYAT